MPLYEYKCGQGHRFEVLLKKSEVVDNRDCIKCECIAVRLFPKVSDPVIEDGTPKHHS